MLRHESEDIMIYTFSEQHTGSLFRMQLKEDALNRDAFRDTKEHPLTIAWNTGEKVVQGDIDGVATTLQPGEVITLTFNQHYRFHEAQDVVAWQFNREFYCIVDHDQEVSCSGLIFFGTQGIARVQLDEGERERFQTLLDVFVEEFQEADQLRGEMLRMLLKRLIVKVTRLYKRQHVDETIETEELDLIRQFGLLVEQHYREYHQVQDYARLMYKSPKTLANLFARQSGRTALQIIHDRMALEAKRRLLYTDDSSAEVGYAIGIREPAHFSRFFKKATGMSPSKFRKRSRMHIDSAGELQRA